MEIMNNPANMMKHMGDPNVQKLLAKLGAKMGAGGGGPFGGPPGGFAGSQQDNTFNFGPNPNAGPPPKKAPEPDLD